jgi:hypothetical protein
LLFPKPPAALDPDQEADGDRQQQAGETWRQG